MGDVVSCAIIVHLLKCLQATPISKLVKQEPQAALQVCGNFIVSIHNSDNSLSGMVKLKSFHKAQTVGFFFLKLL